MRTAARAAVLAALLGLAGCGGAVPAGPELPPPDAAHFVGRSEGGVAASVDLAGFDPTARVLERALAAGDGDPASAVAIVSILNGSGRPVSVPRFLAVGPTGTGVRLVPAREALTGRADAAARAALAALPPPRRTMAADDSAVVYLVLPGVRPADVLEVHMRLSRGAPVRLRATVG